MDWISVEDRLPEDGRDYLCLQNDGTGEISHCISHYFRATKNIHGWVKGEEWACRITHWMPLPDLPTIKP